MRKAWINLLRVKGGTDMEKINSIREMIGVI
jgi:hypothetical protein